MATLLETVNRLIIDNGIAGGVEIESFDSIEPEISRIINFLIAADYEIQNAWNDWGFMYITALGTLTAGIDVIAISADYPVQSESGGTLGTIDVPSMEMIKELDRGSLICQPATSGPLPVIGGSDDASPVPYMEWDEFERTWERRTKVAAAVPAAWSFHPVRSLLVTSHLAPALGLELRFRYWRKPIKLPRHADAIIHVPSDIVDAADAYYDGISTAVLELATVKWARAERQYDLMAVAAEGYRIAMEDLRAVYGKSHHHHLRLATDQPLEVKVA